MIDNVKKQSNIKYIEDTIRSGDLSEFGMMVVDIAHLRRILELIPPNMLQEIVDSEASAEVRPPNSEDPEFRKWFIANRKRLGLSQSELAREIEVRPEQICRFESGRYPFPDAHIEKAVAKLQQK